MEKEREREIMYEQVHTPNASNSWGCVRPELVLRLQFGSPNGGQVLKYLSIHWPLPRVYSCIKLQLEAVLRLESGHSNMEYNCPM